MRLSVLLAVLLAAVSPSRGHALGSPSALCRSAIAAAERSFGVPDRLMQAIGIVESGQPDERGSVSAWPWTINVEGVGHTYDSKQDAIAAVNAYRANGARSIDVGCMQVNLVYHGDAFASLDQAFDPTANARYAAQFLLRLLDQTGSWPRAAAGYHSMTPELGADYARKVLAVWSRPGLGEGASLAAYRRGPLESSIAPSAQAIMAAPPKVTPRAVTTVASGTSTPPSPGGLSMQGSMTARILPLQGGGSGAGSTGRSLASYRAAPIRLVSVVLPRS